MRKQQASLKSVRQCLFNYFNFNSNFLFESSSKGYWDGVSREHLEHGKNSDPFKR